jgi:hypothetical protein
MREDREEFQVTRQADSEIIQRLAPWRRKLLELLEETSAPSRPAPKSRGLHDKDAGSTGSN